MRGLLGGDAFLALPTTAKLKLALHATVALLILNALVFGLGPLSKGLLLGAALVWIRVFLGPISRRGR